MSDPLSLLAIAATFFLAGAVKGVIGLGLPTISLALLTVTAGLPNAMALLLAPSLLTNVWQALAGGDTLAIARRIWPFLLAATATVWIGAAILVRADHRWLTACLGALLVIYSALSLAGHRFTLSRRHEVWAGPALGSLNGVLAGMTGSFVVPGVLFLQAIGLPRDGLVTAMGLLFTASTLALAVALGGNGLLSGELGALSAAALVPAFAGMAFGQRIRHGIPEPLFRRIFFSCLAVLGLAIIAGAIAASDL